MFDVTSCVRRIHILPSLPADESNLLQQVVGEVTCVHAWSVVVPQGMIFEGALRTVA
jgi:hypothetical protein